MSDPHVQLRRRSVPRLLGTGLGVVARRASGVATFPYHMVRRGLGWVLGFGKGQKGKDDGQFAAWRVADDEGMARLARALADPDPSKRELALEVICEFSSERASRLLSSMLHDSEPRVRRAAATGAARVGATGAAFSLILALEDPDSEVRHAARRALEEVTGRSVEADERGNVSQEQIDELKRWWKQRRFEELAAES